MRISMGLAGLALAALAVPAAAADNKEGAKSESTKRVCRVQEETGSRFKKRVCATKTEWAQIDAIAEEAKKNIDKLQRQRALNDN